jgi:hypothetical protein
MTAPALVVVREPSRVPFEHGAGPSEDGTLALAASLSAMTGRDVPLLEGFVRDAPARGLLLVSASADFEVIASELEPQAAAALAARTVLVGGNRADMAATLERFGIAAGIDDRRFFLWHFAGGEDRGKGLFGRKAVAATMRGASLLPGARLETERYGYILGDRSRGLPGEVLDYLHAYVRLAAPDEPAAR